MTKIGMQQFVIRVKTFCATQQAGATPVPFELTMEEGRCKNGKTNREQEGKERN
jgi:hypothetical protein